MEIAVHIYLIYLSGSLLLLLSFNRITSHHMKWVYPILIASLLIPLFFLPIAGIQDYLKGVTDKALLFLFIPVSYIYILNHLRKRKLDIGEQLLSGNGKAVSFKSILGIKSPAITKQKNDVKPALAMMMSQERAAEIELKIHDHFLENRPYLQHGYSLRMLSNETHIPLHHLSAFINKYHKMNFNDFINVYRILFCIDKFFKKEWKYKKLEAIAEEAGFNNRNTFTTAFKKATGLNPSEFLKYVKLGKFQKKPESETNLNGSETNRIFQLIKKLPEEG